MKFVYGDLLVLTLNGHFDVIVHGCNCFCVMGAGIASGVRRVFPGAYAADLETTRGDISKLGTFSSAVHGNVTVVNAYTQYYYGGMRVYVDYDALRRVMRSIKNTFTGKRIGMPLIGSGLAGGSWDIICNIIESELEDEDVTIVILPEKGRNLPTFQEKSKSIKTPRLQ